MATAPQPLAELPIPGGSVQVLPSDAFDAGRGRRAGCAAQARAARAGDRPRRGQARQRGLRGEGARRRWSRPSARSSTSTAARSSGSTVNLRARPRSTCSALELFGMRFGLDRMHKLMTVLGMPQRRFASIHVVGTNGKSSTVRFIAAILERHGAAHRLLHLAAPALVPRADRGGGAAGARRPTSRAAVARAASAAELVDRTQAPDDGVTQFEALTAAAYHELARRGVEVAVIEAGLGGRYDATNVIPSKVQVLTSVGLDHTRWLGPDDRRHRGGEAGRGARPRDARARPGPAPRGAERWSSAWRPSATPGSSASAGARRLEAARRRASSSGATSRSRPPRPRPSSAAPSMRRGGAARGRGDARARAGSTWSAHDPLVIHDGAHNPAGAAALVEALPGGDRGPPPARGGRLGARGQGRRRRCSTRCCRPATGWSSRAARNPRALSPATLDSLARKLGTGPPAETVPDPVAAVERARELAGAGGAVVVTGSIYLIADLVREPGAARASTL